MFNKPDNNGKIGKFVKEYGELVKKYNVDFANFPVWVPDQQGGFKTILQSVPIDLEQQKKDQLNKAFISK